MKRPLAIVLFVVVLAPALAPAQDKKDADKKDKKKRDEPGLEGLKALKNADPEVRYKAAAVMVRLGPVAKFASAELREAFKEEKDLGVKVKMAEAVWAVDRPPPSVLTPFLIEALKAKAPAVRMEAAGVLGQMGAKAKAGTPALIRVLKDKDDAVRIAAIAALGEIGPVAKEAAEPLLDAIQEKNKDLLIDTMVAAALGKLGPDVVPLLVKTVEEASGRRRLAAVYALGEIGAPAAKGTEALIKVLKQKDNLEHLFAVQALGKIGPAAKAAAATVRPLLKAKDDGLRLEAALTLHLLTKESETLPIVFEYLSDEKRGLTYEAALALKQFGTAGKEATARLKKLMEHRDFNIRLAAGVALWSVTGKAEETLKLYGATIDNSDNAIRRRTLEYLLEMGPAARPLTPLIQEAGRDEDDGVRNLARAVLARLATEKP
ncbi:MAG: HEAT repeat domain-containing protein [Gemmataceae bacterium]